MRPSVVAALTLACFGFEARAAPKPYKPAREMSVGNELALVYIGGTNCGFCNDPAIKAAVLEAKALLAERAAAEGRPFSATGVAMDYDLKEGLAFLRSLGPFDQVVVGREWLNSVVLDLMAAGDGAIMGVPQVIVYERTIEERDSRYVASPPKILARIPGTGIPLWVKLGAKTAPEKTTPAASP